MIPIKQTIKHNPDNGQFGDCHRACIASILELPIEKVPHFGYDGNKDGQIFWNRINEFLHQFGLKEVQFAFEGELKDILNMMKMLNPDIHYLLGCASKRGYGHSVVCFNDNIVHDPTLMEPPHEYNKLDGFYWITVLATKVPVPKEFPEPWFNG